MAKKSLGEPAHLWMVGSNGGERTGRAFEHVAFREIFQFGQAAELVENIKRGSQARAQFAGRNTPLRGQALTRALYNLHQLHG